MVLVVAFVGTIAWTTVIVIVVPGLAIVILANVRTIAIATGTMTIVIASRILATRVARHPGGWRSRPPVCSSVC